jgi:hypothetical protein
MILAVAGGALGLVAASAALGIVTSALREYPKLLGPFC